MSGISDQTNEEKPYLQPLDNELFKRVQNLGLIAFKQDIDVVPTQEQLIVLQLLL